MAATPRASKLVLLSELGSLPVNTKVRFIGCVQHYHPPTATLTLASAFPTPRLGPSSAKSSTTASDTASNITTVDTSTSTSNTNPPATTTKLAHVAAHLTLPPATSVQLFETGAWVNVIGLVTGAPDRKGGAMQENAEGAAYVTATLMFPARSLDAAGLEEGREGQYEKMLRGRREAGLLMQNGHEQGR